MILLSYSILPYSEGEGNRMIYVYDSVIPFNSQSNRPPPSASPTPSNLSGIEIGYVTVIILVQENGHSLGAQIKSSKKLVPNHFIWLSLVESAELTGNKNSGNWTINEWNCSNNTISGTLVPFLVQGKHLLFISLWFTPRVSHSTRNLHRIILYIFLTTAFCKNKIVTITAREARISWCTKIMRHCVDNFPSIL